MIFRLHRFLASVPLLLLFGCGGGGEGGPPLGAVQEEIPKEAELQGISFSYTGPGVEIHHVSSPTQEGDALLAYHLDLGGQRRDVYFVFTNSAAIDAGGYPQVTTLSFEAEGDKRRRQAAAETVELSRWARENREGVKGTPAIHLFNEDPWTHAGIPRERADGRSLAVQTASTAGDAVGKRQTFYDAWDEKVNATCRSVTTADGKTLNIWVADDSWSGPGCTRKRCVDQKMVDALAGKFLRPGGDNDILDWVTNLFGAEWGSHPYGNLIPFDSQITVLLHDIQRDDSLHGGILGYYYARDNFRARSVPTSNERLLIALDSVMFANGEGTSWSMTDPWPREFTATLAHELQHMVHFYQKNVLRSAVPETWLNEMCALVAEDFLSTRLEVDGPRGIPWWDGSAGSPGQARGRLPRFDYYNYLSLTRWLDGGIGIPGENNLLNSYALSYAFGAYLARNYGGAPLFRSIVQNSRGDYRAVEEALLLHGHPDDFPSVLQRWGAAVLLSDRAGGDVPPPYRYNTGGFLDSTLNGSLYRLGAVNLHNYTFGGESGPRIFSILPVGGTAGRPPASNLLYRLGTDLSGTISQEIFLRQGTHLTVVVK